MFTYIGSLDVVYGQMSPAKDNNIAIMILRPNEDIWVIFSFLYKLPAREIWLLSCVRDMSRTWKVKIEGPQIDAIKFKVPI